MTDRGVGKSNKLKVLSLFAGIGGFDLGLERTGGFETVAFCEIDRAAQLVLQKHWPEVPIYADIRQLTGPKLASDGIAVDVICGGFPCQDISTAGRGLGLAGERSGLWFDYARLIGELRPAFVIVENVSALLHRGLDAVLGSLAALGYDAEWHCIPASYVGAPHRRDRLWIVAHPNGARLEKHRPLLADVSERSGEAASGQKSPQSFMADANRSGLEGRAQAGNPGSVWQRLQQQLERCADDYRSTWSAEPNVGRVANGVPGRMDRLKQLGNAVVPQIPELIGNAILASLAQQREAA